VVQAVALSLPLRRDQKPRALLPKYSSALTPKITSPMTTASHHEGSGPPYLGLSLPLGMFAAVRQIATALGPSAYPY
jgi:hypothetical protein